jgi:hypothetical protein
LIRSSTFVPSLRVCFLFALGRENPDLQPMFQHIKQFADKKHNIRRIMDRKRFAHRFAANGQSRYDSRKYDAYDGSHDLIPVAERTHQFNNDCGAGRTANDAGHVTDDIVAKVGKPVGIADDKNSVPGTRYFLRCHPVKGNFIRSSRSQTHNIEKNADKYEYDDDQHADCPRYPFKHRR